MDRRGRRDTGRASFLAGGSVKITPQKKALKEISETGQSGAARSTMASLERKNHIKATAGGWELTKRGAAVLAGKLGNAQNLTRMWDKKDREHAPRGVKEGKTRNPGGYDFTPSEDQRELMKSWGVTKAQVIAKAQSDMEKWNSGYMVKGGVFPSRTLEDSIRTVFNGDGYQFDEKPKHRNPGGYGDHGPEERAALKKAKAFFGNDALVTEPKPLRGYVAPSAAVEIGELVALEYDSHKFDGKSRIYRHDVTGKRKMFISIDGSTIIIQPPLKVTKRGIEG
jgi:hypothetical protein